MVILGVFFATTGIVFKLSTLLANMIVGFFFGLAGTCMDLRILRFTGLLAIMIMVTRITGKLLGTWVIAKPFGAPENVRKYLELGLLPKAGVTVGLVLMAREFFQCPKSRPFCLRQT